MRDATKMLDWSGDELFSISLNDSERFQLAAARDKFHQLITDIPMLSVLAKKQGISEIKELNDLCPLLFKHTALKSYPISILQEGRFDKLTIWLDKLTSHDLSRFDASKIETIDEWLVELEKSTPMRLAHSSGTSGKLSFFPRSTDDTPMLLRGFLKPLDGTTREPGRDVFHTGKDMHFVFLGFRGGNSIPRFLMDSFAELVTGREDSCVTLYPGGMSADVLSLQGQLRTAEATGRMKDLKISPALLARRDELLALQAKRPEQLRDFVKRYLRDYSHKPAVVIGIWAGYLELKAIAEEMGAACLFSPDSLITGGGGSKGQVLPDDYYEQVTQFLGMKWLPQFYSMTEINGWMRQCRNNHYHIPPYTIPYLLHPESGEPLPRTGRQTGRFAFFDLLAQSYWGGTVSGDEVSIEWEQECHCGRGNPYIVPPIQRYSEKNGGDDKITCSGAPKAHDDALNFLAEMSGA